MDFDSGFLRKVKKPIVEKRRRDRMNSSLSKLKTIMMDNIKQQGASPPMTKLEKADILEMTVNYICQLKNQQCSVSMTTNALGYQAGYQACVGETMNYLQSSGSMDTQQLGYLGNHLQTSFFGTQCYQGIPNSEITPSVNRVYPNEGHGNSFYSQPNMPQIMDSTIPMTSQLTCDVGGTGQYTREEINGNKIASSDSVWRPW